MAVFLSVMLLNGAATIQLVWFYLATVPSYVHLDEFEVGKAHTPFQYRLLMMWPLRWAHNSPYLIRWAHTLSAMNAWFPGGVRPEGLLQAPIDFFCVVIAGLVARSMYRSASRTGLLTPFVYPLTLVMIACTYAIYTMHRFRFVYDLPSLTFFAVGMYVIYHRLSSWLLIVVFTVGTINRETTLFLLLLYLLSNARSMTDRARMTRPSGRRMLVAACLLAYWIAWHLGVQAYFHGNGSESKSRIWLNVGILLWPTSWAQIMSAFAFLWPLVILLRKRLLDRMLRRWQWIVPVWVLFMMRYGILIETRIFGELIPYVACVAALIAEEQIFIAHPGISTLHEDKNG